MRIILSITCMLISYLQYTSTAVAVSDMALKLADHYLKSFPIETMQYTSTVGGNRPLSKLVSGRQSKRFNKKKSPKHTAGGITDIHLTPREERLIVLSAIFAKSNLYQEKYHSRSTILNEYAWNDLHLFCGTTTTPGYHFLSRINKTITTLGEGALASLLGSPTIDFQELTKRQQLIRLLGQKHQISNDLKKVLQYYQSFEKNILSLWSETDPLYTQEYHTYLTKLFYTNHAALNKKAKSLQWRKLLFRDGLGIYFNYIAMPLLGALVGEILTLSMPEVTHKTFYTKGYGIFIPIYGLIHASKVKLLAPIESRPMFYANAGVTSLISFYQYYLGYKNYKEYSGVLKNLALRMADIQSFLKSAERINNLVQNDPQLEVLYSNQLSATRALLARKEEPSEIGDLLHYLEKLPFRTWAYFSHNAGQLLASYKLFAKHKSIFHDVMYELGQLDAFLSISTLINETTVMGTPLGYTFTKFLSPQQYTQPRLVLANMWNPMLASKVAVGNDIAMSTHPDIQTIILTGPNAGGKSTFLTGVTYALILSQTFGIAPAQSCAITPFSKINTYIDISGDIAAGKSLFQSEVSRFHNHLNTIKQLPNRAFSFSIFDEPFSGTNPKEGAAAEYAVLHSIAKYKNALNIVATHYPLIMLLEAHQPTKGFKNYKVFIKKDKEPSSKIEYTYKIVPGKSTQTIAIDILEEQGYASEILEKAKDIINNPYKYTQDLSPRERKKHQG